MKPAILFSVTNGILSQHRHAADPDNRQQNPRARRQLLDIRQLDTACKGREEDELLALLYSH